MPRILTTAVPEVKVFHQMMLRQLLLHPHYHAINAKEANNNHLKFFIIVFII
jgi:hypothetical protein